MPITRLLDCLFENKQQVGLKYEPDYTPYFYRIYTGIGVYLTLAAIDSSNVQPNILIPKVGMYKGLPYMVLCKALHVAVYNASVNTHVRCNALVHSM